MTLDKYITEISDAIGPRIKASKTKRRDFALDLREELYDVLADAEDKESYLRLYNNIAKSSHDFENALRTFKDSVFEARMKLKGITPLTQFLGDPHDLHKLIDYYEKYNTHIIEIKPKATKGPRRIKSDQVALTIAGLYLQNFGSISTGSGEKLGYGKDITDKETPFDRVCKVIEKRCDIQLSSHTRQKAVRKIRRVKKSANIS